MQCCHPHRLKTIAKHSKNSKTPPKPFKNVRLVAKTLQNLLNMYVWRPTTVQTLEKLLKQIKHMDNDGPNVGKTIEKNQKLANTTKNIKKRQGRFSLVIG